MTSKILLAVFLAGFMIFPAVADDNKSVKVDLAQVVESGIVQPVDGVTSSGQPDADALQVFADSGYAAVVDLRGERENRGLDDEAATVEGLGMKYISFPVTGADAFSFENAKKLDALIASADGPVLLHCGSGNRVGAMLALRASANGASDEEALKIGKRAGLTRLEGRVKELLAED